MNRNRKRVMRTGHYWDSDELVWVAWREPLGRRDEIERADFQFEDDALNQIDRWKFWDKHGAIV